MGTDFLQASFTQESRVYKTQTNERKAPTKAVLVRRGGIKPIQQQLCLFSVLDGCAARRHGLLKTQQILGVLHRWRMYLLVGPALGLQDEELAHLREEAVPPPGKTKKARREGGRAILEATGLAGSVPTLGPLFPCVWLRCCGRRLLSRCGRGQFAHFSLLLGSHPRA